MSYDPFDIQEEASASSNPTIKRLIETANEVIDTEVQIEAIEETLKDLKSRSNHLKITVLPDLMAECGMTSLSVERGHKIELKDFVNGSLPKEDTQRRFALNWLSENGASDIIKSTLEIEFAKTEHNLAKSVAQELREKGLPVIEAESVHPQTLLAFVREKMRKGEEIPLDKLGLFSGRSAKITPPKEKKGSRNGK